MRTVKLTKQCAVRGKVLQPGAIVNVDDDSAAILAQLGRGEIQPDAPAKAQPDAGYETREIKKGK